MMKHRKPIPVRDAIASGNYELAALLIQEGGDITGYHGQYDSTLLGFALSERESASSVVDALLNRNDYDYNAVSPKYGYTALHTAVNGDMHERITQLINKGVHLDVKDKYGETPLKIAINNQSSNSITQLIHAGAQCSGYVCGSYSNCFLLSYAMEKKWDNVVAALFASPHLNVDEAGVNIDPALHAAITLNRLDYVKILLEKDADIDLKNTIRNTPLATAISSSFEDIAIYLVNQGAHVEGTYGLYNRSIKQLAREKDFNRLLDAVEVQSQKVLEETRSRVAFSAQGNQFLGNQAPPPYSQVPAYNPGATPSAPQLK